jgi:hypothetical protein
MDHDRRCGARATMWPPSIVEACRASKMRAGAQKLLRVADHFAQRPGRLIPCLSVAFAVGIEMGAGAE